MIRIATSLTCLLLVACTQDFDAFAFEEEGERNEDPERDGSTMDADGSIGGTGGGGSAGDRPDAAQDPRDAEAPPDDGGAGAVASDAGDDAGDAGDGAAADDGGGIDPACATAWSAAPTGPASCGDCACEACSAPVLACLTQGTATEQMLCQDVLACAVQNGCGDDCYCVAPQCGAPGESGDGACVTQMNAAANGTRAQVEQIISAGDSNEPLVRATQAIDCLLGTTRREVGQCEVECPAP